MYLRYVSNLPEARAAKILTSTRERIRIKVSGETGIYESMKPASAITDRAKRYRANSETSDWPRVCMFCGSTKDLQVDHLDGFEENGEAENLLMLCRSCNQLKSAIYKKAGLGRRTVQYNPGVFSRLFGSRETYRVHGAAHPESRAERAAQTREKLAQARLDTALARKGEIEERRAAREIAPVAVGRYKGFTIYKRRESPGGDFIYYSTMDPDSWLGTLRDTKGLIDHFKNPAPGVNHWIRAVDTMRGNTNHYTPFQAARVIRSTPVSRRYAYLDQMMRANPGIPTYEQYAFAVSTHERGAYDEGGAIIHATPPSVRSEYAQKIADAKARRGTGRRREEVPF